MRLMRKGLDRFIESQIFFPSAVLEGTPAEVGLHFRDLHLNASDGVRLHAWLVPARPGRAFMVFSHGNAGNISHRIDNLARLHSLGISVLIYDYRGYGLSQGRISEAGLYRDAEAAFALASNLAGKEGLPLVVFGRSLGGIAAVHMAAGRRCAGVVLESTFDHLGSMASVHFLLPGSGGWLRRRFNAVDKIARVTAPKLFLHGDRDDIVPLKLGQALYRAAPSPKRFVVLPGAGHNDTYLVAGKLYWQTLAGFIDGLNH